MRDVTLRPTLNRSARLERCEERFVMSADMAGLFSIQDLNEQQPQLTLEQDPVALATSATARTGLDDARARFGLDGTGQTVAIIDSGVAYDHVGLGGGFGSTRRVVGGWDFTEENDANPYDDGPKGFHGTHVAGIVAGNSAGHVGVASGADIVALRVFNDQGVGQLYWVENALRWVHDHRNDFRWPITTVNLSLGINWNSDTPPIWASLEDEFSLLQSDGIFVTVAAGNSFATYRAPGVNYPSASPYVVPVASVNSAGQFSSFSQRNSRSLAAPGEAIVSTVPDYFSRPDGVANDYAAASGTSMASPFVAGASMLVRQALQFASYATINQDAIYNHLYNTADVIYDSVTKANYHRVNVLAALSALLPADDYGSTAADGFQLGALAGNRSLSGHFAATGDRDYFTFTASATGKVTFRATVAQQATPKWLVSQSHVVSGTGGDTVTIDVVAGRSYSVGFTSAAGLGHYTLTVQMNPGTPPSPLPSPSPSPSPTPGPQPTPTPPPVAPNQAAWAYVVDRGLGLTSGGSYRTNARGGGEKWLTSENKNSYFILPDGRLYRFTGQRTLTNNVLVATLDASYYANPEKVHNAPAVDVRADSATLARMLDSSLELGSNGNYAENWGGRGEKWLASGNANWYFITSTGALYRWTGNMTTSPLVATLDASYHASPTRLHEAAAGVGRLSIEWRAEEAGPAFGGVSQLAVQAMNAVEPGAMRLLTAANMRTTPTAWAAVTVHDARLGSETPALQRTGGDDSWRLSWAHPTEQTADLEKHADSRHGHRSAIGDHDTSIVELAAVGHETGRWSSAVDRLFQEFGTSL